MSFSFVTQSWGGCITTPIIDSLLFMRRFFRERISLSNQNQDQHEDVNLKHKLGSQSLQEYQVTLSSGEQMYILAADSMDAAYSALELSEDRDVNLLNVSLLDEW